MLILIQTYFCLSKCLKQRVCKIKTKKLPSPRPPLTSLKPAPKFSSPSFTSATAAKSSYPACSISPLSPSQARHLHHDPCCRRFIARRQTDSSTYGKRSFGEM